MAISHEPARRGGGDADAPNRRRRPGGGASPARREPGRDVPTRLEVPPEVEQAYVGHPPRRGRTRRTEGGRRSTCRSAGRRRFRIRRSSSAPTSSSRPSRWAAERSRRQGVEAAEPGGPHHGVREGQGDLRRLDLHAVSRTCIPSRTRASRSGSREACEAGRRPRNAAMPRAQGPFRVVIAGRPNVGKSALFNRLVRRRRSLVHDLPGHDARRARERGDAPGRPHATASSTRAATTRRARRRSRRPSARRPSRRSATRDLRPARHGRVGRRPARRSRGGARSCARPGAMRSSSRTRSTGGKAARARSRRGSSASPRSCGVSAEHAIGVDDVQAAIGERMPLGDARRPEEATGGPAGGRDREIALAVVGRPNVGKSSLVNALLGEERVDRLGGRRHDARLGRRGPRVRRPTIPPRRHGGIRRQREDRAGPGGPVGRAGAQAHRGVRRRAPRRRRERGPDRLRTRPSPRTPNEAGKGLVLVANKWDLAGQPGEEGDRGGLPACARRASRSRSRATRRSSSSRRRRAAASRGSSRRPPRVAENRRRRIPTGELNRVLGRAAARQGAAHGRRPHAQGLLRRADRDRCRRRSRSSRTAPSRSTSRRSGASRTSCARRRTSRARRSGSTSGERSGTGRSEPRTRRRAGPRAKSSRRRPEFGRRVIAVAKGRARGLQPGGGLPDRRGRALRAPLLGDGVSRRSRRARTRAARSSTPARDVQDHRAHPRAALRRGLHGRRRQEAARGGDRGGPLRRRPRLRAPAAASQRRTAKAAAAPRPTGQRPLLESSDGAPRRRRTCRGAGRAEADAAPPPVPGRAALRTSTPQGRARAQGDREAARPRPQVDSSRFAAPVRPTRLGVPRDFRSLDSPRAPTIA